MGKAVTRMATWDRRLHVWPHGTDGHTYGHMGRTATRMAIWDRRPHAVNLNDEKNAQTGVLCNGIG